MLENINIIILKTHNNHNNRTLQEIIIEILEDKTIEIFEDNYTIA